MFNLLVENAFGDPKTTSEYLIMRTSGVLVLLSVCSLKNNANDKSLINNLDLKYIKYDLHLSELTIHSLI